MRTRNILCTSAIALGLALPLASASYANVLISVDKNTQRMTVSVDGETRYEWPVSTGRHGFDTPGGTFKPNRMEVEHLSNEYENAPMPHSIFFDMNGHAIHGFFDTPHLGLAVSHGCVRLSPANATVLFNLVKAEGMANTQVVIRGQIPESSPAIARRQAPAQQTAAIQPGAQPPAYNQPAYGQPTYAQPPAYSQPTYAQPSYSQPTYDQYGRQPAFPPQPSPTYGRPAYNQPYGGQPYYRQPYGGQPYGGGQLYYQPPQQYGLY